jgi:sugar O-acyltransferase (sialic acid O-acetyltransferase NeuD family)
MKRVIIGMGGFASELYHSMNTEEKNNTIFMVEDELFNEGKKNTIPMSKFDYKEYEVIIAVGDSKVREEIIKKLPKETKYFTYVHPSVLIFSDNVEIGDGSIICGGSILTTNIKIGRHSHLNLQTTIGHDTVIGDFFTSAPGVKISGNCKIGNHVYFGTNSSIRERLNVCNDVKIGLNSGVVKNIEESGTYVGLPVKKIR